MAYDKAPEIEALATILAKGARPNIAEATAALRRFVVSFDVRSQDYEEFLPFMRDILGLTLPDEVVKQQIAAGVGPPDRATRFVFFDFREGTTSSWPARQSLVEAGALLV